MAGLLDLQQGGLRGLLGGVGQGFNSMPSTLMAAGAGLLAHRQNANNPMFDPRMLLLAQATDQERIEAERQREEEARREGMTDRWLESAFGLGPEERMAARSNPEIMNHYIRQATAKPEPAGEWKVVGDRLAWAPNDGSEPTFAGGGGVGGLSTEDATKLEGDLRGEYTKNPTFKRFEEVNASYKRIRSSAQADSGPGDIGVIFGYMKMLDPSSTVREGEFATAESASGVPDQVRNIYNRLMSGERLTPEQRKKFVEAADGLYQQEAASMGALEEQYNNLAQQYGVEPDRVSIMDIPVYEPLQLSSGGALQKLPNGELEWRPQ